MFNVLKRIWKITDLRNSILFVLGMLVIFRAAAHVPIPGVDLSQLSNFLEGNQIFGLLNVFAGGTIENFSIVMLGVAPYITSAIIFQLLVLVVPQLEELQKEGESGQRKITMWTRLVTVPLALLQAFALIRLLTQTHAGIVPDPNILRLVGMTLVVTAGTIFLMWIGELMTEKKIGNGISILIFAAIVSALPTAVQNLIANYNPSDLGTYILFVAIAIITIAGVVFISEGQRNIPVSYARHAGAGGRYGGVQTNLPLRVNSAGVIPIIFAISLVLFPPTIAQLFVTKGGAIGAISNTIVTVFQNQLLYGIIYFVLVFGFTYFYTAVVFHPNKIAENLQQQGGFIPGIRPGKQTEEYLQKTMNRLVFSGASFLSIIAVLPLIVQAITGFQSLAIGGMSLLIIVSVGIEISKQIEAQLTMHEYNR